MKTVFWIASTGGHLRELLGLEPLFSKYNSHVFTEKTDSTKGLTKKYGKKIHFFVFGSRVHLIKYLFKFAWNCILSLYYFIRYKPDAIVTTGTHTAVPMCLIAHFFHKKIIYIETRASFYKLTKTGSILKNKSDLFIVQREQLLKLNPNAVLCEVDE